LRQRREVSSLQIKNSDLDLQGYSLASIFSHAKKADPLSRRIIRSPVCLRECVVRNPGRRARPGRLD
jgi:hypothetical protein